MRTISTIKALKEKTDQVCKIKGKDWYIVNNNFDITFDVETKSYFIIDYQNDSLIAIGHKVFTVKDGDYWDIPSLFNAKLYQVGLYVDRVLMIDADDSVEMYGYDIHHKDYISVSFKCLENLVFPDALENAYFALEEMIIDGEIKLIDFNNDSQVSAKSRKKAKEYIDQGYSFVNTADKIDYEQNRKINANMHRAGTALFLNTEKDVYYLLGFDDGQYFGVELPHGYLVNNLEEAFYLLMPEEARNKKYLRQGEWFVVETQDKMPFLLGVEVPQPEQITIGERIVQNKGTSIILQKDNIESNEHILRSDKIVFYNGHIYAKAPWSISHYEHPTISSDYDVMLVKNTAVRSVSQKGVD